MVAADHVYYAEMNVFENGYSYNGFAGLESRTGKVAVMTPGVGAVDSVAPTMVHKGQIYQTDPYPAYYRTR